MFGVYHTCAERLTFDLAAKAYFACYACAPKLRFSRCSCRVFARYAGAPNRHLPSRVGAFPSPSCHIHSVTDWSLSSSVRRRHVICPHTFPSPIGQSLLHERRVDHRVVAFPSPCCHRVIAFPSCSSRFRRRVGAVSSLHFHTHLRPSPSCRISVTESARLSGRVVAMFISVTESPPRHWVVLWSWVAESSHVRY